MMQEIGHISELVRYPVKSMGGAATDSAFLGWHGLDGDRGVCYIDEHIFFRESAY